MRGLMLGVIVLVGVVLGGAAVGVVLGLSGLEIRIPQHAASAPPAPPVPSVPGQTATRKASGSVSPAAEDAAEMAILEIGPVPEAFAVEMAGELTLAGLAARIKLGGEGGHGAVITVGPHLRATIEEVALTLRRGTRAVTYVIHSGQ